jgi:hypothetical protein
MGKQILFHMFPPDCEQFLSVVQKRDSVVIVERDSSSASLVPVAHPCSPGQVLSFWNRNLLSSLERKYIPESTKGPYYRIASSLPVIEFFLPREQEWDGQPAITQGRIYASFDQPSEELQRWFNATVRWIRKNFVRNPVQSVGGYVGPSALRWHEEGGLLLPMVRPPVTSEWRAFLQPQRDQQREVE